MEHIAFTNFAFSEVLQLFLGYYIFEKYGIFQKGTFVQLLRYKCTIRTYITITLICDECHIDIGLILSNT